MSEEGHHYFFGGWPEMPWKKEKEEMKQLVKELRWIKGRDLIPNPDNWRRHPQEQVEAFQKIVDDIGFAGVLLGYDTDDGVALIDGHMRTGLNLDEDLPVAILDVDDATAKEIMATFDPIGEMAKTNKEKADALRAQVRDQVREHLKNVPKWDKFRDKVDEVKERNREHMKRNRLSKTMICPNCGEEFTPYE